VLSICDAAATSSVEAFISSDEAEISSEDAETSTETEDTPSILPKTEFLSSFIFPTEF